MRVVLKRIGIILVRTLTSSTCVIVHTFHLLIGFVVPSGAIAALSRILHGPIYSSVMINMRKINLNHKFARENGNEKVMSGLKYITLVYCCV